MDLFVTDIQRFCMHDGPGVRTTVFLKGCPLLCRWCHNPETASKEKAPLFYAQKCIGCRACAAACPQNAHSFTDDGQHELDRTRCENCPSRLSCPAVLVCPTNALKPIATLKNTDDILTLAEADKAFYGEEGGLTVSGGEPMLQGDGTIELLQKAKNAGISTAVETCGVFNARYLDPLCAWCDTFLFDIKDTDPDRLKTQTGADLKTVLDHLRYIDQTLRCLGKTDSRIFIRCIIVNGINTDEAHYRRIGEICSSLTHLARVELLPYHAYAGSKMLPLGYRDNGRDDWIPDPSELARAAEIIRGFGLTVLIR